MRWTRHLELFQTFMYMCILTAVGVAGQSDGDARLVNGQNPAEGRVEIYYQGNWGTVCDDGWDISEARVVCRQLGFSSANTTYCCAHFGHGEGQIMLDDLGCRGDELNLQTCNNRGWEAHNCAHTEDAGVMCNGKIRLNGGSVALEGRVELYHKNDWGNICNLAWDMKDANVVCRQMGYPSANSTASPTAFGGVNASIIVREVSCEGTENDLDECPKEWNSTCIGQFTDDSVGPAAVTCTRPIRLIGGTSDREGHIEIFDNNQYGAICDDGWDMDDARVVCRQLGNLAPVQASIGSRYGSSNSPLKFTNTRCTGDETTLEQCGHDGWDNIPSTCSGENLAGVVCSPAVRLTGGSVQNEGRAEVYMLNEWRGICSQNWDAKDAKVFCDQLGGYPIDDSCCYDYTIPEGTARFMGDVQCTGNETQLQECAYRIDIGCTRVVGVRCQSTVRLTGDESTSQMGNIEVLYNGEWGAVCDDNWNINAARVVCRQLGNYEAVSSSCCGHYGDATSAMLLDDVVCDGSESKLEDCDHSSWGSHNCGPNEAAGVSCRKIRLVADDSTNLPKGRVEIVHNGAWGRLCSDGWGQQESNVLCRQLYNSTSEPHIGDFGRGEGPVLLKNIQCTGEELDILDCQNTGWGDYQCDGPDAFVICRGGLRLADGRTPLEGRVEIFHDGQWGTVCDDNWDLLDAKVICRELGNYEVLSFKCCAAYGHGDGPILLDGVACTGDEEILEDCNHEGWGSHNCQHYEDASVACTDLRLTFENGTLATNQLQGRVEVWRNEEWKAICSDSFELLDAAVVCRQLFHTDALQFQSFTPSPDVGIGIYNLNCRGNESLLLDCLNGDVSASSCNSSKAAGVICKDIRLVGGESPSEGAVEILDSGEWGLICGNTWNTNDGTVACRQLGFCAPKSVQRGWDSPSLVTPRRDMHWHDINCTGTEERLRDCPHAQGSFPCHSYNFEAIVFCKNGCDIPRELRHGNYQPTKDSYDRKDSITFSCDEGYELVGDADNICTMDCGWQNELPECQRNLKPPIDGDGDGDGDGDDDDDDDYKCDPKGDGKKTGKGKDGCDKKPDGKKSEKSTDQKTNDGSGGTMFVVGLIVGSIVVVIIVLAIWLVMVRRRNTTGNNIFKPRRQDDMEEPVLSFNASQDTVENDVDL